MSDKRDYPKSIGAIWVRPGKNDKPFMSGILEDDDGKEHRFIIRENPFKKEDKHPKYHLYPDNYDPSKKKSVKAETKTETKVEPKTEQKSVISSTSSDGEIEL